jgi:hypothetical protein
MDGSLRCDGRPRRCPPYIATAGRETALARRAFPARAKHTRNLPMYWASAGMIVVAREQLIAGGSRRRDVNTPLASLMLSPVKKMHPHRWRYARRKRSSWTTSRSRTDTNGHFGRLKSITHWRCPNFPIAPCCLSHLQ